MDLTTRLWGSVLEALQPAQPFLCGGIAGCFSITTVQPVDFLKTRMQLQGEGSKGGQTSAIRLFREIVTKDGFMTLYSGVTAAWMRQMVYGSARLGLFAVFSDLSRKTTKDGSYPFYLKVASSLAAGGIAAFIGNPADLALVRMQADSSLPESQRRNYKGVFDALRRVVREEGVLALWRGSQPTVLRAMALNMAMLTSFAQVKESAGAYLDGENGMLTIMTASTIAGFLSAAFSLPFDMLKTRLQKMAPLPDGTMPYTGIADCVRKILSREGPLAFYKGFPTYNVRIAPYVFLSLVASDFLNQACNSERKRYQVLKAQSSPAGAGGAVVQLEAQQADTGKV